MTAIEILKALEDFLREEVAQKMKFQREDSFPAEYVHPFVTKVSLPPKNLMPAEYQVPCMLVGLEEGSDDGETDKLSIRIICATYGGKTDEQGMNVPDETGYIDLLNLLERVKQKLIGEHIFNGVASLEFPIKYGIYDTEIVYPYWYGYLTFKVNTTATERPMNEFENFL